MPVRLLVPHQANLRIIRMMQYLLGIPDERVAVNLDRYGNTSAASIPIALAEAVAARAARGRGRPGDERGRRRHHGRSSGGAMVRSQWPHPENPLRL